MGDMHQASMPLNDGTTISRQLEMMQHSGKPSVTEESVDSVRASFRRGPGKSILLVQYTISYAKDSSCMSQIAQSLKQNYYPRCAAFAVEMLDSIDLDNYLKRLFFTISGVENRHYVRIWRSEFSRVVFGQDRKRLKGNVCCSLLHNKIIVPTVTG